MEKLEGSCNFTGPVQIKAHARKNWAFQRCWKDQITLLRTRKDKEWNVDFSGKETPKDDYINVTEVSGRNPNYPKGSWDLTAYHHDPNHVEFSILSNTSYNKALEGVLCKSKEMDNLVPSFEDCMKGIKG